MAGMSDELDRVPRYVLASRVREFLTGLGFDVADMNESGIRIGWPVITADIFARGRDGHFYLDETTNVPAVHAIRIPIIEDDEA